MNLLKAAKKKMTDDIKLNQQNLILKFKKKIKDYKQHKFFDEFLEF